MLTTSGTVISSCFEIGLLHLMDKKKVRMISVEEFILGASRVQGAARSIPPGLFGPKHGGYPHAGPNWAPHSESFVLAVQSRDSTHAGALNRQKKSCSEVLE